MGKLSQPFLDRIDMCVEVPKVQYHDLTDEGNEETSATIRERIVRARERQLERYRGYPFKTNARISISEIEKFCVLDEEQREIMRRAYECMGLTARTYHKTLGVARTIADLDGKEQIEAKHLREALSYRMIDHKYWRR